MTIPVPIDTNEQRATADIPQLTDLKVIILLLIRRGIKYVVHFFIRLIRRGIKYVVHFFMKCLEYLLYFIQFSIPRFMYPKLPYIIEEEITSTTTRVIFTRSKHNKQKICLKLWQRYDEKVSKAKLVTRNADYLIEGLEFNRRFAPEVYLGIAPIELSKDPEKIQRGKMIKGPKVNTFTPGVEYALVMSCLEKDWSLDQQLSQDKQCTAEVMKFLAKEVARMHKSLDKSPDKMGKPGCIESKLTLNKQLFEESLRSLASDPDFPGNHDQIEKYGWICKVMDRACKMYAKYFEQRYENGHIKRCHGDLKAANLWIRPKGLKKKDKELIALDCVDFNPDFCHIDTLSDVAMLAIDIEMHLTYKSGKSVKTQYGQILAKHFLYTYMCEMQEYGEAIESLLEYYMTEKSMVCAYVSILYDGQPLLGEKYLNIALVHAQRLEKMLKDKDSETPPTSRKRINSSPASSHCS